MSTSLRVVLAGGSGHVGRVLARHFMAAGHQVTILSRSSKLDSPHTVPWDGASLGSWTTVLDGADVLVNLSGRSVNCRYTPAKRREIMESRIQPTLLLGQAVSQLANPPRLWINASTATIYRHSLDKDMDEATGEFGGHEIGAPESWQFSVEVAQNWEEAFFSCAAPKTRKIAIRSAIILSPERESIFDILLRLVRFRLGGTVGDGQQFVSWIHEADFCRGIDHLISHEVLDGAINVAAPNPLPNHEFMRVLREAWGASFGMPASSWMLEIGTFLLRTESELVLKSRRVVSSRLSASGFRFQLPEWRSAAQDLVRRWRELRDGFHGPELEVLKRNTEI